MIDADRERLLALLAGHAAEDDHERGSLDKLQELAATLPEPFSRTQLPGHFTATALVVTDAPTRVLLIRHRKLGLWLPPGGHIEPEDGVDLGAAAVREAREETGIVGVLDPRAPLPLDVDAHLIPARPEIEAHYHLDLRFLLRAESDAITEQVEEVTAARFVPLEQAIADVPANDTGFTRVLRKVQRLVDA